MKLSISALLSASIAIVVPSLCLSACGWLEQAGRDSQPTDQRDGERDPGDGDGDGDDDEHTANTIAAIETVLANPELLAAAEAEYTPTEYEQKVVAMFWMSVVESQNPGGEFPPDLLALGIIDEVQALLGHYPNTLAKAMNPLQSSVSGQSSALIRNAADFSCDNSCAIAPSYFKPAALGVGSTIVSQFKTAGDLAWWAVSLKPVGDLLNIGLEKRINGRLTAAQAVSVIAIVAKTFGEKVGGAYLAAGWAGAKIGWNLGSGIVLVQDCFRWKSDYCHCGNGTVEPSKGETCEGNCPTKCDDHDPCTNDRLVGDSAQCSAECEFTPKSKCECDGQGDDCKDCSGIEYGTAYRDDCGRCVGGTTGSAPCEDDCAGVPGGNAYRDECGRCVGGNSGSTAGFIDGCGQCVGGSTGIEPCACQEDIDCPASRGSYCEGDNVVTLEPRQHCIKYKCEDAVVGAEACGPMEGCYNGACECRQTAIPGTWSRLQYYVAHNGIPLEGGPVFAASDTWQFFEDGTAKKLTAYQPSTGTTLPCENDEPWEWCHRSWSYQKDGDTCVLYTGGSGDPFIEYRTADGNLSTVWHHTYNHTYVNTSTLDIHTWRSGD